MKRCPECRRDYYDETLLYCLEDGTALVQGSVPAAPEVADEPATAILHESTPSNDEQTRAQIHTTERTEVFPATDAGSERLTPHSGGFSDEGQTQVFEAKQTSVVALRSTKWIFVLFGLVILLGAIGYFGYRYVRLSSGSVNSIAVLPFANSGGDKDTEFLSDGIAETLINNFTKIPELKVTARTTAFRFRGREGEPKEIGRELGVRSVLTGTVLRQNDTVRIQVDLIDTTDGSQMWGHRYDGKIDEIVNIQQKIATDVASRLRLTTVQTQQISKTYTQNAEAYQHYLRGRYYWNFRTGENLRQALAEFERAANKDPNYALAYVGISDSYALLDEYAGGVSPETLPKAKSYAEKALALDNYLAEAYASLGLIYFKLWQWKESENAFTRAIELNPNYPTTYHWYSIMLRYQGRFDAAHDMIKKGAGLDPLSLIIKSNLAISYRNRGELEAALTECHGMQALDPNFIYVNECFGSVYLELGRFDEAIAQYEKYSVSRVKRSSATADFASALARAGRREQALVEVKRLTEMFDQGRANAVDVAQVYSALEENDKAFEWIEKALSRREGALPGIAGDHFFRFIRQDPRMGTVLKRMGLG